jgi:hypothetical protein
MKKKFLLITTLVFLAILLIIVPVSAKAVVNKDVEITWVDDIFPDVCSDSSVIEDINLKGYITNKYLITLDGKDSYHYRYHYNCSGLTGTGLTSGDTYIVTCAFSSQIESGLVGETNTLIYNMNIISPGGADNIQLKGVNHYTINANGELTTDKATFRAVCK